MFGKKNVGRPTSNILRELQQLTHSAKANSQLRQKLEAQAYDNAIERCRAAARDGKHHADCSIQFAGCEGDNYELVKMVQEDVARRFKGEGFNVTHLSTKTLRVSW